MNIAKRSVIAVLIAFGVLLVAAFVMNNLSPSPVAAAKTHCMDQGWADEEITLAGFETSGRISGSTGLVRFRGEKGDKRVSIRVELGKELFAAKWHVVGYDESAVDESTLDQAGR